MSKIHRSLIFRYFFDYLFFYFNFYFFFFLAFFLDFFFLLTTFPLGWRYSGISMTFIPPIRHSLTCV
ncbi:hypothetical protein ER639_05790 [Macrococcus sp. DPC7161]|nr:hypothetical protein ER639_05790 [Macrococcus sp. DPC7161]